MRKKRTRPGTPADAQRAIKAFEKSVRQVRLARDEAKKLEIDLQGRVFDLYGLSSSEVDLLRKTAPPRDPLALAESGELG